MTAAADGPQPAGSSAAAPGVAVWAEPAAALLARLATAPSGLTDDEAAGRRRRDATTHRRDFSAVRLFGKQLSSPITLILIAAAVLSLFIGETTEGVLIVVIVLISALLGFFQEHNAARAVARLLASVEVRARVVRDGRERELPFDELVVGDVVLLGCGDLVPADCRVLEARDLSLDESSLTGESFPRREAAGCPCAERGPRRARQPRLRRHPRRDRQRPRRRLRRRTADAAR